MLTLPLPFKFLWPFMLYILGISPDIVKGRGAQPEKNVGSPIRLYRILHGKIVYISSHSSFQEFAKLTVFPYYIVVISCSQ